MISTVIFDLDGTLVQTEKLKARSYARAAVELCPNSLTQAEVIGAFIEVVGHSRQEVAEYLIDRFNLEQAARERMSRLGVKTPWQAFVQVRLGIYNRMLENPDILKKHRCPHNTALLTKVNKDGFMTGLATMSHCEQTRMVLQILELSESFNFIATRDDVEAGKPDPEIYLLVASQLKVDPKTCLVIEDSLAGVRAAGAAGMHCIAATTEFTRKAIHESGILDEKWIVDDLRNLMKVAAMLIDFVADE